MGSIHFYIVQLVPMDTILYVLFLYDIHLLVV